MVRAILLQVVHHPHAYTPDMAMRQVAMHMLRHPHRFYQYVEQELLETGESYESYCYNIFHCNVWGDDMVAAAFGDMWNLAISIVSPISKKPINLFHTKAQPDVVLLANGGSWMSPENNSTHFSATQSTQEGFRKPGTEYLNPTIQQDMNQKLQPIILDNKDRAKQLALNEYLTTDREHSLKLLQGLNHQIGKLDDHIADLIKESDDMKRRKKQIEHKLGKLGVNIEKMREASEELEKRPYCCTKEREAKDKEEELKRKADEEAAEREAKKVKVIPLVKGEVAPEMMEDVITVEEEENYEDKLKRQQKEIIRKQEILLQTAESQLMTAQKTIATQDRMLREQDYMKSERKMQRGQPTPSTSTYKVGGSGTIDNFLKPKGLTYLQGKAIKKEKVDDDDDNDDDDDQVIIVEEEVSEKKQIFRYVPKVVPEVENLVLVPTQPKKSTKLRTSKLGPVHEKLQDKTKFYCDRCPSVHKRKDELERHKTWNCLKQDPEFICEKCNKGYFWENTLREHYYKTHMDITLYYCTKCGQGFHYRSRVSGHRNACPNKNGPDLYQPRAPFDEAIEETFKRKTAIPVAIPQAVLDAAEEEMGKITPEEQGGASYQVATGEPLEGGVPTEVLSGEPQQLPEEGVGDLLHQMSEGRLTGEPIGTNPEEIEDVDKPLDVEHVYEEEEQK